MTNAPITVFVYNRPWHIKQTMEALKKNKLASQSKLFIFSDGPKNERDRKKVEEVRKYIKTIDGFKSIVITERKENLGLAESIIAGVTEIVNKYGKIIVLEDDLLTSPYFLKFTNESLNFYEKEEKIACIHGYVYPVKAKLPETFFLKHPGCLGWATWKRDWDLFEKDGTTLLRELGQKKLITDFDYNNSYIFTKILKDQIKGKIDSWAIRWYASVFLKNKLTLYPGKSLIFHNGGDNSGTNCGYLKEWDVKISNKPLRIKKIPIQENATVFNEYIKFFKSLNPPFPFSFTRLFKRKIYSLYRLVKIH